MLDIAKRFPASLQTCAPVVKARHTIVTIIRPNKKKTEMFRLAQPHCRRYFPGQGNGKRFFKIETIFELDNIPTGLY